MSTPISRDSKKYKSQAGNAGLLAMIFLAFGALTVLTVMTANSIRESRNLDKSRSKLHEKWQARSAVNTLAQIVARDASNQLQSDVQWARENCSVELSTPTFDAEDVTASSPAVAFSGSEMSCASGLSSSGSTTSVFGSVANWSQGRIPLFEETGRERFQLDGENTKVVEINEIYRRTLSDSDIAYAVRYIVEAKFGNYRTRTNGELILGANLPSCGTSVSVEIVPATIERGNSAEMRITYAYANRLQIFNSAGTQIHEAAVPEQSSLQTLVYTFSPSSTDNYRVTATGAGGCQARSAPVLVTVTEPAPVCPTIADFSASSPEINEGESVTLSWNVQNAFAVTLEGDPVAAIGTRNFTLNATRTFTLSARDTGNTCPVTRQVTVDVRPPAACPFSTPQIQGFSANPASIAIGDSSTLAWSVAGVEPSGTIRITGPNGFTQSVGASGNLSITPPLAAGDYSYTIIAENTCPDGTRLTSQQTVVISVRACPPPNITAFTVSPSTVTVGGNQMLSFAWTIGGTADAVSISNGVGGGLPASGTVTVVQPQTTTVYTLTSVGCGQTRQAQVTVTVTAPTNSPSIGCAFNGLGGLSANHNFGLTFVSGLIRSVASIEPDGRLRAVACAMGGSFGGNVQTLLQVRHPSFATRTFSFSTGIPNTYEIPQYVFVGMVNPADLQITESTSFTGGSSGGGTTINCQTNGSVVTFSPQNPGGNQCTVDRR